MTRENWIERGSEAGDGGVESASVLKAVAVYAMWFLFVGRKDLDDRKPITTLLHLALHEVALGWATVGIGRPVQRSRCAILKGDVQ